MDLQNELIIEKSKTEAIIQHLKDKIEKLKIMVGDDKLTCSDCRGVRQYLINGKYACELHRQLSYRASSARGLRRVGPKVRP